MLDNKQTIKNQSVISYIGLDKQEIATIQTLCNSEIRLNENFILSELDSEQIVDMIFINGDDQQAVDKWKIIASAHSKALPIMLCSEDKAFSEFHTVKKPLMFKNLMQTLDSLTSTPLDDSEENLDLKTARILVVDDSFPARQFMKFKLEELIPESLNIKVDFADSGEKALRAIRSTPFDLVFLDVTMPGRDGYEVCAMIKQSSLVQVAMLTGLKETVDKIKGDNAGCDYYLTKPPKDEELAKVIKSTFDWRNSKQSP